MSLEYGAAFDFPIRIIRRGVLAGARYFGTPAQGIFTFWVNAHLRRWPTRYIGFDGTGHQTRDAFHPRDLATLLVAQMRTSRRGGQRIYTAGGGANNCISLAQLIKWWDERFGLHAPDADPQSRIYDIPRVVMDNSRVADDFGWRVETPLLAIFEGARHAQKNPDWLEVSCA